MSKPDNRWTWFDATMEFLFNEGGCPIGNNRMTGAFLLFIVRRHSHGHDPAYAAFPILALEANGLTTARRSRRASTGTGSYPASFRARFTARRMLRN